MAAVANYNYVDATTGIYGVYNDFIVIITQSVATGFKLQYQIKVSSVQEPDIFIERIIDPIDAVGVVNPVTPMQLKFFKSEYTGQTENTATRSFSDIQIEIGEIYADAADEPATFRGYDTEDVFYFYNGYERGSLDTNYRDPNWYNTEPYKLAKVQKTLYLQDGDIELLSIPSNLGTELTTAQNLIYTDYDSSGAIVGGPTTIDLTLRPDLTGVGYYNIDINAFVFAVGAVRREVYVQWEDSEATFYDSEVITILLQDCDPKYDRYRLRWVNRYGGEEYLNFTKRSYEDLRIERGKKILTDAINYEATTFSEVKNVNNPNYVEVGQNGQKQFRLNSDYLTQEQIDALQELFKSPAVLMFDKDNVVFPMIVEDTNYEIADIRNGLKSVTVRLSMANIEPTQMQ